MYKKNRYEKEIISYKESNLERGGY